MIILTPVVSPQLVKEIVTSLSPNFDENELVKQIVATQDTLCPKVIGVAVYRTLRTAVAAFLNTGTPIPAPYDELYANEDFQKMISWQTAWELNILNRSNIDNAGSVVKTDADYTANTVADTELTSRAIQNKAYEYRRLFEAWWAENNSKFPEFQQQNINKFNFNTTGINCGIIFG